MSPIRDDDITDLLQPAKDAGFGFRQGQILTFDPATGANTISVGGGVLANLPVLSEASGIQLAAGDVVVILKMKSAWAILGKVYIPGDGRLFVGAQQSLAITAAASSFGIPATPGTTQATTTFTPPAWSNAADILVNVVSGAVNSTGATGFLNVGAAATGGTGLSVGSLGAVAGAAIPAGQLGTAVSFGSGRMTFALNSAAITISTGPWTGGTAWTTSPSNFVLLNGLIVFTKI